MFLNKNLAGEVIKLTRTCYQFARLQSFHCNFSYNNNNNNHNNNNNKHFSLLQSCNSQKIFSLQHIIKYQSTWIPSELPKYRDGFNDIPELQNANEVVQKLFSLDMAGNEELRKVIRTMNTHKYETDLEKNIANNTHHIRMLTERLLKNKKDKKCKVFFIWAIDQRKKRLRRLQNLDVNKYTSILKEYNIPPLQDPHKPENKYRFRKFKINVPLPRKRAIEDFEHDRVY